ncbi:hypothetical protein HELRODRAFT_92969, partial [Helobdella robusta]|uniref:Receptor L-domain domain-containing protein n=1 Tax=Helobdella robusta TaxID=6412 RepID=T1G8Q2_HELRO
VSANNIRSFQNCTTIEGSIRINEVSMKGDRGRNVSSLTFESLLTFSTVTEITGYLVLQSLGVGVRNLSFFKNLRVIHGRSLYDHSYSLFVDQTNLEYLGLRKLKNIKFGSVLIKNNIHLCYLQNFPWSTLFSNNGQ